MPVQVFKRRCVHAHVCVHESTVSSLCKDKRVVAGDAYVFYPSSPLGHLGKFFNFSVPWFPDLENGEK